MYLKNLTNRGHSMYILIWIDQTIQEKYTAVHCLFALSHQNKLIKVQFKTGVKLTR